MSLWSIAKFTFDADMFLPRSSICLPKTDRQADSQVHVVNDTFSKKLSHLKAAVALHFAYYNFCRAHQALRVTPAMEAGITDHIWELSELISS
jgi:hypothetical protein